jgi:2-polyprenyl-3-methyl-5-hydroxy-6-metoxy-1,4-benzoquinol methylase
MSVQRFYDEFLESRMVRYRTDGNLRLDLARSFVLSTVGPNDIVADIGCGIGILAEAVARARPQSRVIGLDVSGRNIDYARNTVHRSNVTFVQADLTTELEKLRAYSPPGFDVITLIDVIEHIEEGARADFLRRSGSIARPGALLVMTYPSPEYQRYLKEHSPGELQIIDNVIDTSQLCREAADAGWDLRRFEKVDVWLKRQYVHCVFERSDGFGAVAEERRRFLRRAADKARRLLFRPFRVWYYRQRPLGRPGADK